jgi:fibronectin-binding autotransporter adhesin
MSVSSRTWLVVTIGLFAVPAQAQTTYTWNNTGTNWTTTTNWTPTGSPGAAATDTAQFTSFGTFSGTTVNPTLGSARTFRQLFLNQSAAGSGWTLSGNGSLNLGTGSLPGLVVRGVGSHTINLGTGSATSLTLTGPGTTGASANATVNVGTSSTLTLTGNTVVNTGTAAAISLLGGTLVLDNSGTTPTVQRFTGSGSISFVGGGTLEFVSAAGGSSFSGLTGIVQLASGDGTIRLDQTNASGQLVVQFGSLVRATTASTIDLLNVGQGTLGGTGASDPRVFFTTAPGLTNGVIANSAGSAALGYAIVNGSDFAGYDATRGVIAVTSTEVSGALTTDPTLNANLTGNATIAASTTVAYNTLKISPSAAGQSLSIGSGGVLNTVGILHSGSTDFAITGGSISGGATRYVYVTDPNATLSVSSNLAGASQPFVKSGSGFLALTGGVNQVGFTSSQNFNLAGGTLRVTSTNFDMTTANAPTLRFRGGVIEYDVSATPFTFNRTLGTAAQNVNWNDGTAANAGSGGFSAYSTDPSRMLTVNLGGSGTTLIWGSSTGFVLDGHALRFGSTKSNATVDWQNPIDLNGSSTLYRSREINVTLGEGNAADKTIISGAISGISNVDLLKTGTGVLELSGTNTYLGNTLIYGGTLRINGDSSAATGNIVVNSGAAFGGSGTAGGAVAVRSGGTLAPGAGVGTLTVANAVTLQSGTTFAWETNNPAPATGAFNTGNSSAAGLQDRLDITGGTNTLTASALTFALIEVTTPTFTGGQTYSWLVAATAGTPTLGSVTFDLTDAPTFAAYGGADNLFLSVAGNNVYLNFTAVTPIPEPGVVLPATVAGLAAVGLGRRRFRS